MSKEKSFDDYVNDFENGHIESDESTDDLNLANVELIVHALLLTAEMNCNSRKMSKAIIPMALLTAAAKAYKVVMAEAPSKFKVLNGADPLGAVNDFHNHQTKFITDQYTNIISSIADTVDTLRNKFTN